LIVLNQRIKEL